MPDKVTRIDAGIFLTGILLCLFGSFGAVFTAGWIWGTPVGVFAFLIFLALFGYVLARGA